MSNQILGLIIGGVFPAIFFGLDAFFSKVSMRAGIGMGIFLLILGFTVSLAGMIVYLLVPDRSLSFTSGAAAAVKGVAWSLGTGCAALGLTKFGIPLSKLSPLFNMGVLVAVALSLVVFSEWKEVQVGKLCVGTMLIMVGAVIVSKS